MKNSLRTLISAAALGTALPAFAGPDWLTIEQARQNQRLQVAQMGKLTAEEKCAAKRLVLPLDHGPRAQTTPYLNELRKQRFDAELQACRALAAKETVR